MLTRNLLFFFRRENTLRLWLPQLFTKIDEYTQLHGSNHSATLCQMLYVEQKNVIINGTIKVVEEACTVVCNLDKITLLFYKLLITLMYDDKY